VVEHAAETLAPPDFSKRGSNLQSWSDNSAIEPLMVLLKVVVLEILVDYTSQIELPEGEKTYQNITRGPLASNVDVFGHAAMIAVGLESSCACRCASAVLALAE